VSFVIGFTLLACGIPLIATAGMVLLFWVRDHDERIVFSVMLAMGVASLASGVALIA
jgi:hypothetical protein